MIPDEGCDINVPPNAYAFDTFVTDEWPGTKFSGYVDFGQMSKTFFLGGVVFDVGSSELDQELADDEDTLTAIKESGHEKVVKTRHGLFYPFDAEEDGVIANANTLSSNTLTFRDEDEDRTDDDDDDKTAD